MTGTATGEKIAAMAPKVDESDFGQAAETPSGKGADDENFPVGSWLLPARLRPHVAKFYAFARAIDDIADNPDLQPEDKIRRLDRFEQAIAGQETDDPALATAHRLRASLRETGVTAPPTLRWPQAGAPAGYAASDALCSALQVINHLQDCGNDYRTLDRVYLPQDWMAAAGVAVAALAEPASSAALRQVLDRCLDATAALLGQAGQLPGQLRSRHLAMESAVIVALAHRLVRELRARDPLAQRVVLNKAQTLCVAGPSALGALARRILGRPAPRASSADRP